MTLIPPTVTDVQAGYSVDVTGPDASVVVFILSESVPPVTTDVKIDGVDCTRVLLAGATDLSLQIWVLDGVTPGAVVITITGDQDEVFGVALRGSGGVSDSAGDQDLGTETPTLPALGTHLQRAIALATVLPSTDVQIFNDNGNRIYQNDPGFTVNILQGQGTTVPTWVIESGDGSEIWTAGVVVFDGVDVDFTPSPCATLYIETDLVPGLSEGESTDVYPIPDFGTAGTEPWGGGQTQPLPADVFSRGFYWHETGAPGTDGPWMEQHNDFPVPGFPGSFRRQLIQNEFAEDTPPELYEYQGKILDQSSATETHWTLFGVAKADEQPEDTGNDDETNTTGVYDYGREWFGSSSSWGLAYYSDGGSWYLGLHVGYDLVAGFLELPVALGDWFYFEARMDAENFYLRVGDTEISKPVPAGAPSDMQDDTENSLQWGDFDHHMGWTLLQICDVTLHCARRQTRRWEIQDKYGFTRSPEEDCSGDPEPPPLLTLGRMRPFGAVIGF